MHSLNFAWHAAILDPVTGLGVLILPNRWDDDDDASRCVGRPLRVNTEGLCFLGEVGEEYAIIMRQLASIGWVLPKDRDGMAEWFVAGITDCCGRTMISLEGLDRTVDDPNLRTLSEVKGRIRSLAAWACCEAEQTLETLSR